MKKKHILGFTLIELLVVIGILSILLAITLIAINPTRQFQQANDTKRKNDIVQILNSVHMFAADSRGTLPAGILTNSQIIGSAVGMSNICSDIVTTYIPALPQDPDSNGGADITNCAAYTSDYYIMQDLSGRVTVSAGSVDVDSNPITVTR